MSDFEVNDAMALVKSAFGAMSSGMKVWKGIRQELPSAKQEEIEKVDGAFLHAEKQLNLLEAQMAKAFDYTLCHCGWPPTPMLEVGRVPDGVVFYGWDVLECPRCLKNNAGRYEWHRRAPTATHSPGRSSSTD
jgi:hypothetical protein